MQTFGGLFCHRPTDKDDPWLAGADCNGVPQNETAAVIAALTWAIQSQIPTGTCIEIVPDAKYAIGNANAEYSPKSNKAQIKMLHAIIDIARKRFVIEMYHIKSHKGHPWNGLADILCGTCGAGDTTNTSGAGLPPWSPWTLRPQAIECASNDIQDSIEYPKMQGSRRDRYFENGEAYALPAEVIWGGR